MKSSKKCVNALFAGMMLLVPCMGVAAEPASIQSLPGQQTLRQGLPLQTGQARQWASDRFSEAWGTRSRYSSGSRHRYRARIA
jgi:hypothetical protein